MSQISTKWIKDYNVTPIKLDQTASYNMGSLNLVGDSTVGRDFHVVGNTHLDSSVAVGKYLGIVGTPGVMSLTTGGDATIGGFFNTKKDATIGGGLLVGNYPYTFISASGDATIGNDLSVLGKITVVGIEITGDQTVVGNMRVTGNSITDGNVGIGTVTPTTKLEVYNGNVKFYNVSPEVLTLGSGNSDTKIAFQYPDSITKWMIGNDFSQSHTFKIATDDIGVTDRVSITQAGNFGLGTTTPGSTLQVNGNTALGYSSLTVGPVNGLTVSGSVGIGTTDRKSVV